MLSIILVQFLGIYGALIGSIIALFYRSNDIIIYAARKLLDQSPLKSYRKLAVNLLIMLALLLLSSYLHPVIETYFQLILWVGIYFIIASTAFFGAAGLYDRNAFALLKTYLNRILRHGGQETETIKDR